jgi:hypothetical protein
MLVVCFGIVVATSGALLSFTGGWSLRQRARLIFHVGSIAGATTMLALVGSIVPGLAACAMGGWFVVLAVIYLGHAIGVRQWGSPMNRAVLLFGLCKFPYFARTHSRSSIQACLGLIGVFAAGWAAMRFDLAAGESARTEFISLRRSRRSEPPPSYGGWRDLPPATTSSSDSFSMEPARWRVRRRTIRRSARAKRCGSYRHRCGAPT